MERYRIYRRDNYIEIVSESGSYIFKGFVKDVKVIPDINGKNRYRFYGISKWSPCIYLKLPQILDENGDRYTLSDWEDFYNQNTGNFNNGGGGAPFDPSLYDLDEFQNGSLDVFIRESDLLAYSAVTAVANYSALPDPTTVPGEMYIAENSEGTSWLWGSLGGTYYPEGTYYSNGVKWVYQKSAYQATQMEVDAGLNNDKFVTPNTLEGTRYIREGQDTEVSVRKMSAMTRVEFDALGSVDTETAYLIEEDSETGWTRYVNTTTSQTLTSGIFNTLSIVGSTISVGVPSLINISTNKIVPQKAGDYLQVDLAYTVETPVGTNNYIDTVIDVDGIVYRGTSEILLKGAGNDDMLSFSFGLPVESSFFTNGATIQLKPSASLVIKNIFISVVVVYKAL